MMCWRHLRWLVANVGQRNSTRSSSMRYKVWSFESIHSTFIISAECLLPCCQVTLSQKLKSGHSRDTNIVVKAQGVSSYLLKEEIFDAFLTKGVMTNRRVEMHGSRRWLFRLLIWRSMFQSLVNACSSMESCSYQIGKGLRRSLTIFFFNNSLS